MFPTGLLSALVVSFGKTFSNLTDTEMENFLDEIDTSILDSDKTNA